MLKKTESFDGWRADIGRECSQITGETFLGVNFAVTSLCQQYMEHQFEKLQKVT